MENLLLYVHILSAAIWFGGAAISVLFLISARNLSPSHAKPIIQNVANLGKFVFGPTSILVLISGIGLISVANWSFSDLWISIAFTGILISIFLGIFAHSRAGRKALAAADSDSTEATISAIKSWLVISYFDLAIIALVLAAMVFKPGA